MYHCHTSQTIAKYEKLSNLSSILSKNAPKMGGNSFYLAINETIQILDSEPAEHKQTKKVIMFLSDGGDCASK